MTKSEAITSAIELLKDDASFFIQHPAGIGTGLFVAIHQAFIDGFSKGQDLEAAIKMLDVDTEQIKKIWVAVEGKAKTYEQSSWSFTRDHLISCLKKINESAATI